LLLDMARRKKSETKMATRITKWVLLNFIIIPGYLFRSSKASENVEREKQTTSLIPVRSASLCVAGFDFVLLLSVFVYVKKM